MKKRLLSFALVLCIVFALMPVSALADSNEQQIYNYLTNVLGLNTAAASGALANIAQESAFNPHAEVIDTNDLTSYGICQWNGSRFTSLKKYCDDNGYDWSTLSGQLHYLQKEFESSEAYAFSRIKNVPNTKEGAYTAGYNWAKYFERCAEYYRGVNQYEQRAASASDTYWPKYSGEAGIAPGKPVLKNMKSVYGPETTVTLTWAATKNTTQYNLLIEMWTGKEYSRIGSADNVSSGYQLTFADGEYRICLQAVNDSTYTNGKWEEFTVDHARVKPPVLSIATSSGHPKLTWNSVNGAVKYWIYRSTDGESFSYYVRCDSTSYVDKDTKVGTNYYYKVRSVAIKDGTDAASDYSSIKSMQCKPAAPTLKITSVNGKPGLYWDEIEGVDRYRVYRSTDGVNFSFYDTARNPYYTNSAAAAGTTYYYMVCSVAVVDGKDVASGFNNTKSMFVKAPAPAISITAVNGHPKISWDAVHGANRYWIYRSTDGTNYKYYDATYNTSYTNNSTEVGTTYYYKVRTVSVSNGEDYASDYSNVKSLKCTAVAPTLSITTSSGHPKITWNAIPGANRYWVYRSTDGVNYSYYNVAYNTSYTDNSTEVGTTYYYKVRTVYVVSGNDVASGFSDAKSMLCKPAAPTLKITAVNGKPGLYWDAIEGADRYWVYRSTDGVNFSFYDTARNPYYTNSAAAAGQTYYYKVRSVAVVNGEDVASSFNNTVSMTVK